MTRFVIDEDLPRSTSRAVLTLTDDVRDIRDHHLRGASDEEIFNFAQSHRAVLITGDMGFSNIIHFPLGSHWGIVVAHFPNEMENDAMNRQLIERLKEFSEAEFMGNLIIIEPGKVRMRKK